LTYYGSKWEEIWGKKLVKELIFYMVAANVIALIAGVAGASLPVILFSALLIPPIILLIIRIIR